MNPRHVTILRATDEWAVARKTYNIIDGVLHKVSDYRQGKYYTYQQYALKEGHELLSWRQLLLMLADDPRAFRIYGTPKPECPEVFRRLSEHMIEDELHQLLMLDVDGWASTLPWSYDDTESIRMQYHDLLKQRGLDYLVRHDCLLMFSQSSWDTSIMKAHPYYWLQTGLTVEQLRQWCHALKLNHGSQVLDHQVYKSVQPDYITRRAIDQGAEHEFLTDDVRIHYIKGSDDGTVPKVDITSKILETIEGAKGKKLGSLTVEGYSFEGNAWDILEKCGGVDGINQVAYPAAARLVKHLGKRAVRANIQQFAEQMHAAAWEAISKHSDGGRGSQDDQSVYSVARFRQYLESACTNLKGGLDELVDRVDSALTAAEGGELQMLLSKEVMQAFKKLSEEREWKAHFYSLRKRVNARSVGISWSEYKPEMNASSVSRARTDGLLEGEDEDAVEAGAEVTQRQLIDSLMSFYAVYEDRSSGIMFVDLEEMKRRTDGGYYSFSAKSAIETMKSKLYNTFTWLDVFPDKVPELAYGLLVSKSQKEYLTRRYAHTSHRTGGVLWQNLGIQDGKYQCLRVDHSGSTRMTWAESFKDDTAPIWESGAPIDTGSFKNGPHPFSMQDVRTLADTCGVKDEPWARLLFEHVRVQSELDEMNIIGFLMGELMDAKNGMIMSLQGNTGSGKTHTATRLLDLIHPVEPEDVDTHKLLYPSTKIEDKDFLTLFGGKKAFGVDNLSGTLPAKVQDTLCSVATGITHNYRILYTHTEANVKIKASVILTGLSDVTTREDLGTRTVFVDVRDKRSGKGYTDRVWGDDRAIILEGLNRLACRVLCYFGGNIASDRNLIQEVAMRIYHGGGYKQLKQWEHSLLSSEGITRSPFASAFAAYIVHNGVGLINPEQFAASEIYKDVRQFITDNNGEDFSWQTPFGVLATCGVRLQQGKHLLPPNVKSFGNALKQHMNSITTLTGRDITRVRDRSGTSYLISPQSDLPII